jgi:hypothetical protein
MAIFQLTELIQMKTPLGDGWAIVLETTAHDYFWTIALESGALVTFTQDRIRIAESYTLHRGLNDARMRDIIKPKV